MSHPVPGSGLGAGTGGAESGAWPTVSQVAAPQHPWQVTQRDPLEHSQSRYQVCTGVEVIILWGLPVLFGLGHWFQALSFSFCTGPCKLCSSPCMRIPVKATMLNYTTETLLFQKFYFFNTDLPRRDGRILYQFPTTTLSLVLQIMIKNHVFSEEIRNWQISAGRFRNNKPGEVVSGWAKQQGWQVRGE